MVKWVCTLGLLAWLGIFGAGRVGAGKVLVMPVDGSHWLSLKLLVTELSQRGHEVLVLVPETSILIEGSEHYQTQVFHVPFSMADLEATTNRLHKDVFRSSRVLDLLSNIANLMNFTSLHVRGCKGLLYDQPLMQRLHATGFNLVLTDPFLPCGAILSDAIGIPAVYFLRGIPCGLDLIATQCPSPLSYVPLFFSGSSDVMTFSQRVTNVLISVVQKYLCRVLFANFDELASEYLGRDTTYVELLGHGAVWLLRYDFTFEYPRPVMPNMVLIGGINCVKRKALPEELQTFVDESGEHGFIVFTLGSIVSQMPEEKARLFFDAFRQIPQRVVWRYTGPVPTDAPSNVKVMKWLPQNDLLGHPKARLFITHGGTHGIYEGICNAVPMVLMPLFGDQGDNVDRMVIRGAGEMLSIHDISTENILMALNNVINNASYKDNIVKLSAVHKDRPIEPLDLAVHWTEFVMRHKGAAHLRPAAHDLSWVQYHCLDVIGLLVVIIVTIAVVTVKSCTFCFRKCCRRTVQKRKKE